MFKVNLQFFSEEPQANPQPTNEGDKTFTQEEVNRIVSERLNKEKGKISTEREAEYSKREQELNRRELKLHARETLSSKNMPSDLLDVLNYTDKASLDKSIEVIEQVIKKYKDSPQEPQTEPVPMFTFPTNTRGTKDSGDPIRSAMGLRKG